MKKLEYLILTVIFTFVIFQSAASAQEGASSPGLYVIVQHTDGSTQYDANYTRLQNEIMDKYSKNKNIVFVSYDVTNDAITANTKGELDWLSVYNAAYENNGQEGVIIMDASNKSVIARYNLDAGTKDILKSIAEGTQMIARANQ
ncbi:MAG: hypothetical protein J0M18_04135 [Ignavibacteria bacterium]|jgi:hypothetical protein|nr:hypothetical protein [Ignavibacteria bacterium]